MSEALQKKATFVYAECLIARVNRPAATLRAAHTRGGETYEPEWPTLSIPGTCEGPSSTETVPLVHLLSCTGVFQYIHTYIQVHLVGKMQHITRAKIVKIG